MKKLLVLLACIFSIAYAKAEDSGVYLSDWKIYSSYSDVNSSVVDEKGRIWCSTKGGILVFDSLSKAMKYLSYDDGLLSTDFYSINRYNNTIIAGTGDGILTLIDEEFNCTNFSDIFRASFNNPRINIIKIYENKAFIGGGFGLTVFDMTNKIFTETVTKMGDFNRNTEVNDIYFLDGKVYAATKEGLAYANLNAQIQDPSVWKSIGRTKEIMQYSINLDNLHKYNDILYMTADSLVLTFAKDTFAVVKKNPVWSPIYSLFVFDGKLCYNTPFEIADINGIAFSIPHPLYDENSTRINYVQNINEISGKLFIAYTEKSFGIYENSNLALYDANSPLTRSFTEMQIDSKGRLWASTGKTGSAKGITMFDGENWHNFYRNTVAGMKSNAYFKVYIDNKDNVYGSNWGTGFAQLNYDNELSVQYFNNTNSPLSLYTDNKMTIATGFKQDRTGALWLLNAFPSTTTPLLIKRNTDGSFESFLTPASFNVNTPYYLEIDNSETKWIGSSNGSGLFYQNIDKGLSGYFTSSNSNIQSNTITGLAYDKLGTLWIATTEGLSVMINPGSVVSKSTTYIRKVSFLGSNYINCIYIDAVNNKWVGTNKGVWVLSPDGTEVLGIITTKNSELTTDAVLAITSNPETGRIYLSTDKGLFTAKTLFAAPEKEYSISCYPQPFDPERDINAVIEGLVKESYISITTIDGKFIRSIQVLGNRAVWDGKDDKDEFVGNGVYLLIASSTTEGQYSVGKIAVKRR